MPIELLVCLVSSIKTKKKQITRVFSNDNSLIRSINSVGSVVGLAVNMVMSFFLLKALSGVTKPPTKIPKSDFSQFRNTSPVENVPDGSWTNDATVGNAFGMSSV